MEKEGTPASSGRAAEAKSGATFRHATPAPASDARLSDNFDSARKTRSVPPSETASDAAEASPEAYTGASAATPSTSQPRGTSAASFAATPSIPADCRR
jgi:hypothetical protein